jgi:hypothetical protein
MAVIADTSEVKWSIAAFNFISTLGALVLAISVFSMHAKFYGSKKPMPFAEEQKDWKKKKQVALAALVLIGVGFAGQFIAECLRI